MGGAEASTARGRTVTDVFEEAPLPEGAEILAEIHLLGWALAGGVAGDADRRLALLRAVPPGDGLMHVTYRLNGKAVSDGWHERRPDGSGRNHRHVGEDRRGAAREVSVDLGLQPASGRLRRIIAALPGGARIPEPGPQLIRGALDCAERSVTPGASDPGLLEIHRLILAHLLAAREADARRLSALPQAVEDRQRHWRRLWSMDARAAAAARLAAHVPAICAQAHEDTRESVASYQALAALAADQLRAGWWDMTEALVIEAVRRGYAAQLDALGTQFLAETTRLRDAARDQVAQAQAQGDRRAVRTLLREGEFALRWPRSFRPFLLGDGDPPVFDPRAL
ncbi:MAG: hypothetical protein ACHP9Z_25535 [Streptosporangiales bacterium]